MPAVPRAVLDTNTVLSALVFSGGRLAQLRSAWQQARFEPLASKATVAELVRVLAYAKFGLTPEEQRELLSDYLPYAVTVKIPAKAPRTPDCRDPGDVPFLQLAVAGKADFLVSGDRDLLTIEGRFACPIVTPQKFFEALEK